LDFVWIILGSILLLVGLLGCIVPGLPGPPIAWFSLPLLRLHSDPSVHPDSRVLLIYGVAVAVITVLDYYLPIWGTKRFGGTRAGKIGSIIGLVLGMVVPVFGPITIIIGPFAGAVIGEILAGQSEKTAFRSGIGSFLGFLGGTLIKFAVTILVIFKFVTLLI